MTGKTLPRAALLTGLLFLTALNPRLAAQEISLSRGKDEVPVARIFDASKNETSISVAPLMQEAGMILYFAALSQPAPAASKPMGWPLKLKNVYYTYPGRSPARPPEVGFTFISGGEKEQHEANLDFSVSADGEQLHRGRLEYSQVFYQPGYLSVLTAAVPTDLFLRVAGARKVRFQVGRKSYELGGTERKHVRALAETVEALSK